MTAATRRIIKNASAPAYFLIEILLSHSVRPSAFLALMKLWLLGESSLLVARRPIRNRILAPSGLPRTVLICSGRVAYIPADNLVQLANPPSFHPYTSLSEHQVFLDFPLFPGTHSAVENCIWTVGACSRLSFFGAIVQPFPSSNNQNCAL